MYGVFSVLLSWWWKWRCVTATVIAVIVIIAPIAFIITDLITFIFYPPPLPAISYGSLAEADQSYNYTKKDLKMQKYTLRRVQSEMAVMQSSLFTKDKMLKDKNAELEILMKKVENSVASRRCIISSIAKTEHCHKDILRKYSHLEVENVTIQSQL